MLLFWDSFVPEKFLADKNKLWKFGMLHYSEPFSDDYKITYLAAYVTYGMCNSSEFINKYIIPETREEKKAVKHARLDCFGEYKRIFFHSEGMTEAKPVVMTYAEEKKNSALMMKLFFTAIPLPKISARKLLSIKIMNIIV